LTVVTSFSLPIRVLLSIVPLRVIIYEDLLGFPMSVAVAQPFIFFLEFVNEIDSKILRRVTPACRGPIVVPKELEI
jgi:hypothetical protein